MTDGLLDALGAHLPGGPRRWPDLVVFSNLGTAFDPRAMPGNVPSNRGFNAVLYGAGSRVTHYLKVRSASYAGFEREVGMTLRVGADPSAGHLLPRAWTFETGPLRVLALEHVDGPDLARVLAQRRSPDAVVALQVVAEVLKATRPLADVAATLATDADAQAHRPFDGPDAELGCLADIGLSPLTSDFLRVRFDQVPLPGVPQHGDLWPRNLLRVSTAGSWKVLDFETFALPEPPLYDVFHLLRGSARALGRTAQAPQGAAPTGPLGWLERWCGVLETDGGVADSAPLRDAFAPWVRNLTPVDIDTAAARYLVSLTAGQHAKGDLRTARALLAQLEALPPVLESGRIGRAFQPRPMPS